jgi:histidinol-phosphate aminotransferase
MPEIKKHLKNLERTGSRNKSRRDYIRLDMNENPCGLPKRFINNVLSGIDPGFLSSYPEYPRLRQAIARHNKISPENIILANGSDAAIKYIFDAYVSPKDKVLLTDPTFAMYPVYCRMFDAEPVMVKYNADLSFAYGAFMDKIDSSLRMAVIVNPNNPTGSVLSGQSLIRVIEKTRRHNVLLVVDEAYFYYYPGTLIRRVNDYDNLIVLRTFSKLCAMAALRLGYAAASPGIISGLSKVKPAFDVNGIAALFCERLLEGPAIIRRLVKESGEGKRYLEDMLRKEGIEHRAGKANFVLIKCKGKVADVLSALAKNKILAAGSFSQEILKDYIRVTVADKDTMQKFWRHFVRIWRDCGC